MSLSAIVLAAGKGTRMRSPRPKLLHSVLGEHLVSYPLRALHACGVRQYVIVVGHAAKEVETAIRALPFLEGSTLVFAEQTPQLGTGHAVQVALGAARFAAREWLIVCGDSPHLEAKALRALLAARKRARAPVAVLGAELADPSGYGRLVCDKKRLLRIVEERDASDEERALRLVNAGAYAVTSEFLVRAVRALRPKNVQRELYLTDIVAAAGGAAVYARADLPDVVLGVNSQAELARSQALLGQLIVRRWQDRGVTIEPGDVVIGPRVELEPGAVIERGATLLGATRVRTGAHIEHHAHLFDVLVGPRSRVKAFTYAENAELGTGAQVGPSSRLRTGAVIEDGAEIGNFCEVKKTRVKKKAKSHHVSYLGDAEIGSGTNIGAGTIICNYNGFTKPFSRIGADAFIGSNSTLVAPVVIENDAYVAAGSVITEPVPKGALAFGRARQETKPGYARVLKAKLGRAKSATKK